MWYANCVVGSAESKSSQGFANDKDQRHQPIFYNHYFMEASRIPGLLAPFLDHVPQTRQLEQISTYIDLLALECPRKPDRHPHTRRDRHCHFGESFFAAPPISSVWGGHSRPPAGSQPSQPARLPQSIQYSAPAPENVAPLDLGSGAGTRATQLRSGRPARPVTLIESNNKRPVFSQANVSALHCRASVSSRSARIYFRRTSRGIVTLRAVYRADQILPPPSASWPHPVAWPS